MKKHPLTGGKNPAKIQSCPRWQRHVGKRLQGGVMDLIDTTQQVKGAQFRFSKIVDLSGTSGQVRGLLVCLTHNDI
jgi:hypothetical protein